MKANRKLASESYPETRVAQFVFEALHLFGPDAAMRGQKSMTMPDIQAMIIEYVREAEHQGEGAETWKSMEEVLQDFKLFIDNYDDPNGPTKNFY